MGRKKVDYVLVNTRFGYSIVNKRERKMLLVCDDELHEELVKKCWKTEMLFMQILMRHLWMYSRLNLVRIGIYMS